jgi:hypothetical protein
METKFRKVVFSKENVVVVKALRDDEFVAGVRSKAEALASLMPVVPFAPKVVKFVGNIYDVSDTEILGYRFTVASVGWRKVQPKVARVAKVRAVKVAKATVAPSKVARVRHIEPATLEELALIRRRAVQWNFN